MNPQSPILGVIGGSGLYRMPDLEDTEERELETPYGRPSAPIVMGTLEGCRVAFLARHGLHHTIMPSHVNYRANLYALKLLGVSRVVGVNACGSLREDYAPGHIVVPDQVYDHTHLRERSFFGNGLTVHVSVAEPFCPNLSARLVEATRRTGAEVHSGGAFIIIEGPRFSTRLESNVFRSWGMTLIGMTTCPEVFLAREAELCYASLAHVTDYDSWHATEEPVTAEMIVQTLNRNTAAVQQAVRNLVQALSEAPDVGPECACEHALADALVTRPTHIPAETRRRAGLFIDKYLKS